MMLERERLLAASDLLNRNNLNENYNGDELANKKARFCLGFMCWMFIAPCDVAGILNRDWSRNRKHFKTSAFLNSKSLQSPAITL